MLAKIGCPSTLRDGTNSSVWLTRSPSYVPASRKSQRWPVKTNRGLTSHKPTSFISQDWHWMKYLPLILLKYYTKPFQQYYLIQSSQETQLQMRKCLKKPSDLLKANRDSTQKIMYLRLQIPHPFCYYTGKAKYENYKSHTNHCKLEERSPTPQIWAS